ncbi:MAG: ATP-binding protein [Planctomycetes bacterium]|nr:ATP-binding protein [Planctomycetota bacterium]
MSSWSRRISFQVDVAGIIQIMGTSLYSRSDTPIRELLQNAHDAIQRRRLNDLSYKGQIQIRTDAQRHTLEVSDDGIGLTADEAEKYLGTLGIGITGLLKGRHPSSVGAAAAAGEMLIGQFGIGLFSAFLLADRIIVESRKVGGHEGIRWTAGEGTEIDLQSCDRTEPGTTIRLELKSDFHKLADSPAMIEAAVKEFADYLPVPIYVNESPQRANVINAAWFDPTPDPESVELALHEKFNESPLDIIPIRIEKPVSIAGALYVTPQRTPGFAGEPVVTTTIKRMVISRDTQGLLPQWASFLRGVLELNDCSPTASREDLVRDAKFEAARQQLERLLFEHFERLAKENPAQLEAVMSWHRYSLAGAALSDRRLRDLLRQTYRFTTSAGPLTCDEILARSTADPLFETDSDRVLWYNTDRRQERWVNSLFAQNDVPCVQTLRSFEESLLAAMTGDVASARGESIDLRIASPSADGFAAQILGVKEMEDASAEWQDFLSSTGARVMVATFRTSQPVMAFLNDRHELQRTYEELKRQGTVPAGFQRLIDSHFSTDEPSRNEVLLNRNHRLVRRTLEQRPGTPLASVLRLLVISALNSAGAAVPREAQSQQSDDLDWIAEALWGQKK